MTHTDDAVHAVRVLTDSLRAQNLDVVQALLAAGILTRRDIERTVAHEFFAPIWRTD